MSITGRARLGRYVCLGVSFGLSLGASAAPDGKQWKERDRLYRLDAAVLKSEAGNEAAKLRLDAQSRETARMAELRRKQAISEDRLRKAQRDESVAAAETGMALEKLRTSRSERQLDGFTAGCDAGKVTDCARAVETYAALFAARAATAALEVKKAEAELALESFRFDGIRRLTASGALDPAILVEEQARLDARRVELAVSERLFALAKQATQ